MADVKAPAGTDAFPTIEGYEVETALGSGAMGAVYRARQHSMDRLVALKVISRDLSKDGSYVVRFLREAKAVGRLNHPNIVHGYDAGESDGRHYISMELVDGESLDRILERERRLTEPRVVAVARDVAKALDHAGEHGLVHRDIKPSNLILTPKNVVKVTDFGLARGEEDTSLTATGTLLGTPNYISPEQARGEGGVDIRSDLYSLGATLYHLLAGKPPFKGASAASVMAKHITDTPTPLAEMLPGVSAALCELVHRLMAKDPAARPQTPAELLEALDALPKPDSVGASAKTMPPKSDKAPTGSRPRGSLNRTILDGEEPHDTSQSWAPCILAAVSAILLLVMLPMVGFLGTITDAKWMPDIIKRTCRKLIPTKAVPKSKGPAKAPGVTPTP